MLRLWYWGHDFWGNKLSSIALQSRAYICCAYLCLIVSAHGIYYHWREKYHFKMLLFPYVFLQFICIVTFFMFLWTCSSFLMFCFASLSIIKILFNSNSVCIKALVVYHNVIPVLPVPQSKAEDIKPLIEYTVSSHSDKLFSVLKKKVVDGKIKYKAIH